MPLTGSVNISQCRRSKYVTGELDHQVSADRVRVGPQVVGLGSHADHVIGAVDRSSEGRPGGAVRIQHRRLQRVSCQLDGHASREEIEVLGTPLRKADGDQTGSTGEHEAFGLGEREEHLEHLDL